MKQLPLFFKKNLLAKPSHWISYETQEVTEFYTGDPQTVSLEIGELEMVDAPDWWKLEFPNTHNYFQNKKANLVICYGMTDWMSPNRGVQGADLIEGSDLFVWWRVESLGFLTGISENLNKFDSVDVKIDLMCDDDYFERTTERYQHNKVAKLSVSFGNNEDLYTMTSWE